MGGRCARVLIHQPVVGTMRNPAVRSTPSKPGISLGRGQPRLAGFSAISFSHVKRRGPAIQTTQLAAAPTWPRYAKGLNGSVQESAEQRGCHEADVNPEEAYRR